MPLQAKPLSAINDADADELLEALWQATPQGVPREPTAGELPLLPELSPAQQHYQLWIRLRLRETRFAALERDAAALPEIRAYMPPVMRLLSHRPSGLKQLLAHLYTWLGWYLGPPRKISWPTSVLLVVLLLLMCCQFGLQMQFSEIRHQRWVVDFATEQITAEDNYEDILASARASLAAAHRWIYTLGAAVALLLLAIPMMGPWNKMTFRPDRAKALAHRTEMFYYFRELLQGRG